MVTLNSYEPDEDFLGDETEPSYVECLECHPDHCLKKWLGKTSCVKQPGAHLFHDITGTSLFMPWRFCAKCHPSKANTCTACDTSPHLLGTHGCLKTSLLDDVLGGGTSCGGLGDGCTACSGTNTRFLT